MLSGNIEISKALDEEKRKACARIGITLIEVPYFWDKSKESLLQMIEAKTK